MPQFIDLHLHTVCSDGVLTASELLEEVRSSEVAAFSVTDHDTLTAYQLLRDVMTEDDPELVTGVELSVMVAGDDMHLLAYLFDLDDTRLTKAIEDFQKRRNQRARQMVERLNDLGLNITFEEVAERASREVIGRPHIAEVLHTSGQVGSFDEAFHRYIGDGRPAYIPKSRMSPAEAIEIIHGAGGLAVMAHPYVNGMHSQLESLLPYGLDGLEVYHYTHSKQQVSQLRHLADRFGLIQTGGSDFHGRNDRSASVGSQQVPLELLVQMKERAQLIRSMS